MDLIGCVANISTAYQNVDKAYPHADTYRMKSCPKTSCHIACNSRKTRLQNILRSSGIDSIEKPLLKQPLVNLATAQKSYIEKQKISWKEINDQMGYRDLFLKKEYRSSQDNIVCDFYIPILQYSTIHKRAAGLFSSSSFAEIVKGIASLIQNNEFIELAASPILSAKA